MRFLRARLFEIEDEKVSRALRRTRNQVGTATAPSAYGLQFPAERLTDIGSI